jgi:hydrogenase maturation protease
VEAPRSVAGPDASVAPTLVVGLGNPLLGDDGVGWAVVDDLERRLAAGPPDQVALGTAAPELERLAVGGLGLMERMVGHDRVVLVDATRSTDAVPGTVTCGRLGSGPPARPDHVDSSHDVPLSVALAAGRALGARLPAEVTVVGIEAWQVDVFGEDLSPAVAAAVPRAVEVVIDLLDGGDGAV